MSEPSIERSKRPGVILPLVATLSAWGASGALAQVETFDLPRLDQVEIDGDFSDWEGEQGFGVEVLLQEEGTYKSAEDHNVHFRAGWNDAGILIYLTVQDDHWVEYPQKQKYYSADVVEVFLAAQRGDDDVCQWYITPGMTDEVSEAGVRFRELRRGPTKGLPADLKVFREKLGANRYRMEILAPWSGIGKEGAHGTKAAFQIWVNDKDPGSRRKQYMSTFYPKKGASYATQAMHNIRLVDDSSSSLRISSLGEYDTNSFQPFIRLWATAARAGKTVSVKLGDTELGRAVLNDSDSPGRSTAKIMLPPAPAGQPYEKLGVYLEERKVNSVSLPFSDVIGALKTVYDDRARYREIFKLDEPWEELIDAPLLERHRGLAAAGLNLLEQTPLPNTENDMEILAKTLDMLAALDKGEDYFSKQRNGLWGYYFCKADGTGQRFSMTIPRDFDPSKSYPLFVDLHGNGGRPLPTLSEAKQADYFQIRPWGRGDISYFGLGEVDVLESMAHVMKWYPIDPDRICLGGHSMGGNATWDLASKYSNLFACLVPKAGRSGDDYYENFRHLRALIQHGARDSSQPVDFGRYTVSRLEQLGFPVIYKEFPDDAHAIRDPYPVEEWFVEQRRPRRPAVITYTCDTTRTGEAYWARVRRFIDPHRPATIDARVADQVVDLKLKNVEAIDLNLADLPSDPSKPLSLKIDAERIELAAPQPDKVTLVLADGSWSRTDSWTPPPSELQMRPYLPGGAGNLYTGEPLLIVYPTEGESEVRQLMEASARNLVLYGGYGRDMITGGVPIKADKDVTDVDIEHRNLILLGGPKFNLITRRLADQLPVKVNADNQFVLEGHPPMDAAQSSLTLTHYNPLAAQRLIHLIWQDEVPDELRERFPLFVRNRLPGASGRYPHNIPDLQMNSREPSVSIRRQFTWGWKLKQQNGADIQQLEHVAKEGIDIAKLRIMQAKAGTDFAISQGAGSWGWSSGSQDPPSLDQFRYRNYRMTTFKARLKGSELEKIFADPVYENHRSFPPFEAGELEPDKAYTIVAPENILWTLRPIKNIWTDVSAGPDILKADIIADFYGVQE